MSAKKQSVDKTVKSFYRRVDKFLDQAAMIVMCVVLAALIWIILVQFSLRRTREYDADVKVNIRNAARAQEAYFKENGTYTNSVSDLRKICQVRELTNILI